MSNSEALLMWAAVWLYGAGFLSFLFGLTFRKDWTVRIGWYLAIAGFVSHSISIVIRWIIVGHPPVMRTYENSVLASWFTIILFIILKAWHKKMVAIGVAILPIVLLMLGKGLMSNPYHEPMSPPYQSNWMWLHVFFAWSAYGAFCIAAGLGVVYLSKERAENKGRAAGFHERLPDLRVLNDLMLRSIIFGFISLTVEIGAGALWAYGLWGRYWGWDPIETWSLITWLIYGVDIHLGVTLGWKGKRMAWLVILSLLSVFITFGGIGYFSGVHTMLL